MNSHTELNTTAPANSAFTVTKGSGNTEQTLSGTPSISGRVLTLTLETAVVAADTNIKVDYQKPGTNPLQDTSGGEVASFTDLVVGNALADSVAPSLHDTTTPVLAANGKELTITFSETLRSFPPANSVFHRQGDAGRRYGDDPGPGRDQRRDHYGLDNSADTDPAHCPRRCRREGELHESRPPAQPSRTRRATKTGELHGPGRYQQQRDSKGQHNRIPRGLHAVTGEGVH